MTTDTAIPLSSAYYCPSCDAIQPDANRCVTCGESNVWLVRKWLDREPEAQVSE